MPPETIAGRYRVVREAGRGGMGSVWLCTDDRLGREVAVKQIGHLPGNTAPDLARALREARSSAALNHPNVVAVYDAIEEGDHVWLVMEYVPGRTLSQIVREDGPLAPERAAWIGAQVADGLAAAHERGTVHRDVKPGNILVGQDDLAKISDFGIARTLGEEKLTESGMLTGTPAYFSPEISRGEDPTAASDVWALGASLYAAVQGRSPYPEQRNALAMLAVIADQEPPTPTDAGPLAEPIRRMMDPDPATRWTMADAAQALRRLHVTPGDDGTPEQTAAFPAPVPVPVPEPTPAEAAPVPSAASPPPPGGADRGAGRGAGRALLAVGLVALLVLVVGSLVLLLGDRTEDDPAAGASPSETGTRQGGTQAAPSGDGEPEEPEETSSPPASPSPSASSAGGGSRFAFVEDYYAVLPDDTEAGWAMLSPEYQAATEDGYDGYSGFWSTIDDVVVEGTEPGGPGAVDVTLTYTDADGTEQEVRRIWVERGEDGYLITDDRPIDG